MSLFPQWRSPAKLVLEERVQVLTSDQLTENPHLLIFWLSDLSEEENLCPVDISDHHPCPMWFQRTQERVSPQINREAKCHVGTTGRK